MNDRVKWFVLGAGAIMGFYFASRPRRKKSVGYYFRDAGKYLEDAIERESRANGINITESSGRYTAVRK